MSSRTVLSIVANAVVAPVTVAMTTANSARVTGDRRTLLRADRDGQFPQASTLCAMTLRDKPDMPQVWDSWGCWDRLALMSLSVHPRQGCSYQPKTRAAVAETAAATSSAPSPRAAAMARTVSGTR